jgi:hypothetical protein
MKKSNDNIGNRTRDLPACSTVPQPTAPPRALVFGESTLNYLLPEGVVAILIVKVPETEKYSRPLESHYKQQLCFTNISLQRGSFYMCILYKHLIILVFKNRKYPFPYVA